MSRPQGLTRLEVARGLSWATWDAVFITLYMALTTGAFQIGMARYFGANDLWLGIITSVPSLTGALQILTAYLADISPSRKILVLRYSLLSRLPFIIIACLPLLDDSVPRLPLFTGLLILSAVFGSFAGPAFLAWLSDLVPADYRGRYFGKRNMILGLVSAASALPPAIFLDQAVKYHRFSPAIAFSLLYGLGAVFVFASLWALKKIPEPPRAPALHRGLRGLLEFYRQPFRTRNFRLLLGFNTFLVFGQMFAGQFFTVYQLEQINMPYLMVQIAGLIAALFSSLAMPLWGYLADKFGNKPLLMLSLGGTVFLPFLWFLSDPDRYLWSVGVIFGIQVFAGFLWAGVGLTQFNLNVAVAPSEQRAVYMGALAAIITLVSGLSALASGALMEAMKGAVQDPARFFILFAGASLFRLFALPWLWAIREPQERPMGYVLAQLRASARPRGWVALRQLRRKTDMQARLQAIHALAEHKPPLAVEELVNALHDPVPAIRRAAAHALGEIGDPRAVPALLTLLTDPASDMVLEACEALGRIASPEALPELLKHLASGHIEVRKAVISAVQQIGDPTALPPLLERLTEAIDPIEQAQLLEAIASLIPKAHPEDLVHLERLHRLPEWLDSSHLEVRRSAGAALSALPSDPSLARILRERIEYETDPTVLVSLVRALARHGEPKDVGRMLKTLTRVNSPIARQQIVLACAQLLGSQESLYALLTAEEPQRDRLIERALAGRLREKPDLADALRAYAYGDYSSALQILLSALPRHPRLRAIENAPATVETWLLAVSLAGTPNRS